MDPDQRAGPVAAEPLACHLTLKQAGVRRALRADPARPCAFPPLSHDRAQTAPARAEVASILFTALLGPQLQAMLSTMSGADGEEQPKDGAHLQARCGRSLRPGG